MTLKMKKRNLKMNKSDFEALNQSSYTRKELCWIILYCLEHIQELNAKLKEK